MSSKKQNQKSRSKKPPSNNSSIRTIDFLTGEVEKKMAEYKLEESRKRSMEQEEDSSMKTKKPKRKQEGLGKSNEETESEDEADSPGRVTRANPSGLPKKDSSGKLVFLCVIQSIYFKRNHTSNIFFLQSRRCKEKEG